MPRYYYTCDRGHMTEQVGELDERTKMCGEPTSKGECTLLAKRAEVSTGTRFHVKS